MRALIRISILFWICKLSSGGCHYQHGIGFTEVEQSAYLKHTGDNVECCVECKKRSDLLNKATSWFHYAGDNCVCFAGKHVLAQVAPGQSSHSYTFYKAISMRLDSSFTIGYGYEISIVFRKTKSNDAERNKFYAIDDLQSPNVQSHRIYIDYYEAVKRVSGALTQQSNLTKKQHWIDHKLENHDNITIFMYNFTIKIAHVFDKPTINFMYVQHAQEFISMELLRKRVALHQSATCRPVLNHHSFTRMNVYTLDLKLATEKYYCYRDIVNVTYLIHLQNALQIKGYKVVGDSVVPTSSFQNNNQLSLQFARLYIDTAINLHVYIVASNETFPTSQFEAIFVSVNAFYIKNGILQSFVSDELRYIHVEEAHKKQGFYIRDLKTGFCFQLHVSNYFYADFHCSVFSYRNQRIYHDSGLCLNAQDGITTLVECVEATKFFVGGNEIFVVGTKKYLSSNVFKHGKYVFRKSEQDEQIFLEHGVTFGLPTEKTRKDDSPPKGSSISSSDISFLKSPGVLHLCSQDAAINGYSCCLIDLITGVVNVYPKRFEVIGFDLRNRLTYGKSMNRMFSVYNGTNLVTMSESLWKATKDLETTILAGKHTRDELIINPLDNMFAEGDVSYSVTYFGIQQRNSSVYQFYWPTEKNCGDRVGQTKTLALGTCLEVLQYCSTALSGFYWLCGDNKMEYHYVYCDMETDGGGWLMVNNYTVRGGILKDVPRSALLSKVFGEQNLLDTFEGFTHLKTWYDFQEFGFYCYADVPGRTLHFKTLRIYFDNFWKAFETNGFMTSCIIQVHDDDNSLLGKNCYKWFGRKWNGFKFYNMSFIKDSEETMIYGNEEENLCDSIPGTQLNHGEWKLFVK